MYKNVFGKIISALFMAVLSFIVIYKGVHIPITYDECVTAIYIAGKDIIRIMLNPGGMSNNHILNTLSVRFFEFIPGTHPWTVRLPNMLSFFLFGICMYQLAEKYFSRSSLFFCLPFVLMFANPYLLDFYSLARGYGMANAFMACSVLGLLYYSSSLESRWYFISIVFAMLAAYANFTFLIYWAAVHVLLLLILFMSGVKGRSLASTLSMTAYLALGFTALCAAPLVMTQKAILTTFSAHEGFYHDTVLNEVDRFLYGNSYSFLSADHLAWLAIGLTLISAIVCLLRIRKNMVSALSDPLCVSVILLVLVFITNLIQVHLFKTSYLADRTALIYYVLFVFVLIFLIRDMSVHWLWLSRITLLAVSVFFVVNFARAVNLRSVNEWSYDAYTYEVLNYMDDYRHQHPAVKKIDINSSWLFYPSLSFYTSTGSVPWLEVSQPHTELDTASRTLFYYTTAGEAARLPNYLPVRKFIPTGQVPISDARLGQVLMIRK